MACLLTSEAALPDADDLLDTARAADRKHAHRQARVALLEARKLHPDQPEILWRLSKASSQLAASSPSTSERRALNKEALEAAERAASLAPDDADARLSMAIALGRVASHESPSRQVEMSKAIRTEAEAATRLDPGNSLAWHVLGRWHYEVANFNPFLKSVAQVIYGKFPDASNQTAADCFQKALTAAPGSAMDHVEYGRALAAMGRTAEGAEAIRVGLSLPSRGPEDNEAKARGKKSLAALP